MIAVRCANYKDRPLLGRVKEVSDSGVEIYWFMGSYTGKWKEWTGKEGGKKTIYTDTIPYKDILHTHIHFTSSMRLPSGLASDIKKKY